MIPFFEWHAVQVGPFTLYVWGFFVALGILAGTTAAARLAKARGFSPEAIWNLSFWAVVGGFLGARLVHVLAYDPGFYLASPVEILRVWDGGWSSTGGLIGGTIAGVLYARHKRLDVLAHADLACHALPLSFGIGRIGCFLIHDHPGTLTHSLLGVRYPDGVVRHDLGLYLAIDGLVLFGLFLLLRHRLKPGDYVVIYLLWEGTVRFLLDFLRINDARYGGLTPAQFLSIAMVAGGIYLLFSQRKSKQSVSVAGRRNP